jgi:hypothetical protein
MKKIEDLYFTVSIILSSAFPLSHMLVSEFGGNASLSTSLRKVKLDFEIFLPGCFSPTTKIKNSLILQPESLSVSLSLLLFQSNCIPIRRQRSRPYMSRVINLRGGYILCSPHKHRLKLIKYGLDSLKLESRPRPIPPCLPITLMEKCTFKNKFFVTQFCKLSYPNVVLLKLFLF